MKVDVHDRLDAVGAAAWGEVHRSSRLRSPFLSWRWQDEWVRAFLAGRRIDVRTVKDEGGRLIAVLPLYEAEPGIFRLIGGVDVSDYLDLLVLDGHEHEAWSALFQSRHDAAVVWDLHVVPAASPTVGLVPELAHAFGLTAVTAVEERSPVLDLPGSWEAYLERLPSRHRHEILRKIRRLQRECPDAEATCARHPAEFSTRFSDFLDLHRRSHVGKARFMDARMEEFFRLVTTALSEEGAASLWFLDTAAGAIAAFLCLEWDGTVALYNSGFHPARAPLAPGIVLLAHLIQDAIGRGKRRFDFLRGEERYKYEFGPVPEEIYAVRIEPPGGLSEIRGASPVSRSAPSVGVDEGSGSAGAGGASGVEERHGFAGAGGASGVEERHGFAGALPSVGGLGGPFEAPHVIRWIP